MKKEILTITKEKSEYEVIATCSQNDIVKALTEHIVKHSAKGDRNALDILFSVTVHYLTLGGRALEEEYVSNLKKYVAEEKKSIENIEDNQKQ